MFSKYTSQFGTNMKLAYPIMLGQLGHMLVALVDNVMVGELGAVPLAAVSLGNSLIYIALSIGIGFSFALTPLVAEAQAASKPGRLRSLLQNGLVLNVLNALLLMLVLFCSTPLLGMMSQPDDVVVAATPYMQIVTLSMFPLLLFQVLKQFSDGMSITKHAMNAVLISNVVNIGLNYVLIYGWGSIPAMGIEGAAWGTCLSRVFMLVLLYIIVRRDPKLNQYFQWRQMRLSATTMLRILNQGLPTALQMLFEVGLFTSAILLAGRLGVVDQAANQIALNLASITFMIAVGLSVASMIRVGNQYGERNLEMLKTVAISNVLLVFLIEAVFAIGFMLFKEQLPLIYIDNPAVINSAASLIVIAGLFQLSDGVQVVVLGSLRGLQDVWVPSAICFVAYWLVGFPISWTLHNTKDWGVAGIWWGLLVALSVSAVLLSLRFHYKTKKLSWHA